MKQFQLLMQEEKENILDNIFRKNQNNPLANI